MATGKNDVKTKRFALAEKDDKVDERPEASKQKKRTNHPDALDTNIYSMVGPGSSVGIDTDYGLDGPGSNPGGDGIFRPSRPALGSTQPPVKWVLGLSRG